jgi:hypothetical protein
MLAARQHDPERLAAAYKESEALVLTIDGRQPEKGHETLYVVRELVVFQKWRWPFLHRPSKGISIDE